MLQYYLIMQQFSSLFRRTKFVSGHFLEALHGVCQVFTAHIDWLLLPLVFNALHGMQTGYSDEKAVRPTVCLSVRLSVKHLNCDKTEERSAIFLYHTKVYIFWEEEWLVRWRPFLPEILGHLAPDGAKSPILNRYSLVALQPEHLAKKVQLTLIGTTIRAFQWA